MTDGKGRTTYSYNSYRQVESETRTFTALSGNYYKLNYDYNVAGQTTQVNHGIYALSEREDQRRQFGDLPCAGRSRDFFNGGKQDLQHRQNQTQVI